VEIDSSEAVYVESRGTKLAVIRLSPGDGSRVVYVAGIVGRELKRVACARTSLAAIPITYGPCADKIAEVFAVTLGK
jgi:hypothetical protein